ncbi:MAG TPA: hypothetical protein PLV22_08075, partial [Candidatus Cloacimonadota bacterium]|nr:hypothetical protein [Candidatus Cloacimonadota bacterium]
NYKYMMNIMNKVNEHFKTDTPSIELDGVQKDYDELLEEHHVLAEKYSEIAYENKTLTKSYDELLARYTELLKEKEGTMDEDKINYKDYETFLQELNRDEAHNALRKEHEELIIQYHQLQSEHTSLQHRYDKLISKIESIRDSMKGGSND